MRFQAVALALVVGGAALGSVAHADGTALVGGPWVGVVFLDSHLHDYRWDTSPRTAWGLSGLAQSGRFAGGARFWTSSTTQATGIPGDDRSLHVSLTGVDGIGEFRLATFAGARLCATADAGLIRFAWSPSSLDVSDGLGGPPLVVSFDPVNALDTGVGLAVRRALPWSLEACAAAERSAFSLSTSHRRGDVIVTERETFGSWTSRFELTRRLAGI